MRKLTERETKKVKAGEVICFWANFKVNKVKHTRVYGNIAVQHTDNYLGVLYPLVNPFKYGKY